MGKTRVAPVIFIVALATISASCDGLFTSNVFGAFDGPTRIDPDTLDAGDLSELSVAMRSEEFYQDLNVVEIATIEAFLIEQTTRSDAQTRATAAESLSVLYVRTSPAGVAVRDVSSVLDRIVLSNDGADSSSIQDILDAAVPSDATVDSATFSAFIDSLYDLLYAYQLANDVLHEGDATIVDPGTAFQGALISHVLTTSLEAIVPPDGTSPADVRDEQIAILYQALTSADTAEDVEFDSSFGLEQMISGMADPGSGLEHIVAAAGMSLVLDWLSEGVAADPAQQEAG